MYFISGKKKILTASTLFEDHKLRNLNFPVDPHHISHIRQKAQMLPATRFLLADKM